MKIKIWTNERTYNIITDNPSVLKKVAETYENFEYTEVVTWA